MFGKGFAYIKIIIGEVVKNLPPWIECDRSWVRESRSGRTKDYEIGICCLSAKHAALRRKSKGWLARNQDNVSEWGHIYLLTS